MIGLSRKLRGFFDALVRASPKEKGSFPEFLRNAPFFTLFLCYLWDSTPFVCAFRGRNWPLQQEGTVFTFSWSSVINRIISPYARLLARVHIESRKHGVILRIQPI